ncbi:MAG: glutamyl-tRNA reductase [Gammaproteobacteria bacterium]
MSLLALGINHTTAPLEIRERVAFPADRVGKALHDLIALPGVAEAAILSTCNRTEVYCQLDDRNPQPISAWLRQYHALPYDDLDAYIYQHPDQAAVRHMLRVASGLDSMILGEPQILGQIKSAYQDAQAAGTLGLMLGRLFQHTFAVAKQVRTDTAIGASPVSVAFAAVSLARQIFGDLSKQTALLIGAGETIELTARHLHQHGIGRMIIANRTVERAHGLAAQFNAYAIALADLPAHLAEADIVISSTASQLPILGKGSVESALKARKHRPMFMVDIAVPRDIEAEVATLPDVYLYTVDDLREVIQEGLKSRQEAAKQAEEIIDVQVSNFMDWMQSLDAVSTICAYRSHAEHTRDQAFELARQQLAAGKPPEEVLKQLAHTLTNKLIHTPTTQLRLAGAEGRADVLDAARRLFDLKLEP